MKTGYRGVAEAYFLNRCPKCKLGNVNIKGSWESVYELRLGSVQSEDVFEPIPSTNAIAKLFRYTITMTNVFGFEPDGTFLSPI